MTGLFRRSPENQRGALRPSVGAAAPRMFCALHHTIEPRCTDIRLCGC